MTMSKTRVDLSMSLDGYVAGPNPSLELPLGEGGELLHEWAFKLKSFVSRTAWKAARSTPMTRSPPSTSRRWGQR
jgi:hypothetical protein